MTGVCGGGVQKTASANPANISEIRTTRGAARLKPVGNDPSSAGMALGSQIKPRTRAIIVYSRLRIANATAGPSDAGLSRCGSAPTTPAVNPNQDKPFSLLAQPLECLVLNSRPTTNVRPARPISVSATSGSQNAIVPAGDTAIIAQAVMAKKPKVPNTLPVIECSAGAA